MKTGVNRNKVHRLAMFAGSIGSCIYPCLRKKHSVIRNKYNNSRVYCHEMSSILPAIE